MEYIPGHAVFTPEGNVKVGDNVYGSKHILIACGGRPTIPAFPGVTELLCLIMIYFVRALDPTFSVTLCLPELCCFDSLIKCFLVGVRAGYRFPVQR